MLVLNAGKNVVNTIAPIPFFFSRSSSNLQVKRTDIKFGMRLISGQIGIFAFELLTLECRRLSHRFIMETMLLR